MEIKYYSYYALNDMGERKSNKPILDLKEYSIGDAYISMVNRIQAGYFILVGYGFEIVEWKDGEVAKSQKFQLQFPRWNESETS